VNGVMLCATSITKQNRKNNEKHFLCLLLVSQAYSPAPKLMPLVKLKSMVLCQAGLLFPKASLS